MEGERDGLIDTSASNETHTHTHTYRERRTDTDTDTDTDRQTDRHTSTLAPFFQKWNAGTCTHKPHTNQSHTHTSNSLSGATGCCGGPNGAGLKSAHALVRAGETTKRERRNLADAWCFISPYPELENLNPKSLTRNQVDALALHQLCGF